MIMSRIEGASAAFITNYGSGEAVPVSVIEDSGNPTIDSGPTFAAISAAADTANQSIVAAPGADLQIWVMQWYGSADTGDGSIAWQDEDDTALSGVMAIAQNLFVGARADNFSNPVMKVATNKALELDTVT